MPIPQVDLDRGLERLDGSRAKSPQLALTRRHRCMNSNAEMKIHRAVEGEACDDRIDESGR
jgi:hypothetical protein